MKKKLLCILSVLLLMCGIPLFTTNNRIISDIADSRLNAKKAESVRGRNIIYSLTAEKYKEEYCAETVKALAVILYSNYKYNPDKFKPKSDGREKFTKKYGEKRYAKLTKAVDSVCGKYIAFKGRAAYIPCFYSSAGYTKTAAKYPYIKNAASPWDNTVSRNKTGVSLNGINSLCKKGCSYKQALGWYLRDVVIEYDDPDRA